MKRNGVLEMKKEGKGIFLVFYQSPKYPWFRNSAH